MTIRALVWIIPASTVAFNTALVAGEPIRFTQPKTHDRPLRFNFANPKVETRPGLNAVAAPSPTSLVSGHISAETNQPSLMRAVSDRTWSSLVTDPPAARPENDRPQLARKRRTASESDSIDATSPSGLFSKNVGLAPSGPGSGSPENSTGSPGTGTDRRTALRGLLPETTVNRNSSSSAFGGVDGTFSGSLKQSFNPSAGPTAAAGAGASSRQDRGGLGSNSVLSSAAAGSAPAAIAAPDTAEPNRPKPNPKPTSPRPAFNPADRPLNSNFELPARPR